jgi:rubrerythrin
MKYRESWDISSIPDELIFKRFGEIMKERRQKKNGSKKRGGRPKKLYTCEVCGFTAGAREFRLHHHEKEGAE